MAEVSDIQSTLPPTDSDVTSSKVHFLNQDTYNMSNGHHGDEMMSHDTQSSVTNSNAVVNGSVLPDFPLNTNDVHTSPKQSEAPIVTLPQLSFEDNFMENGTYDDDDDESDDFVDQLELARIRHLSTIVEGAREDSNSATDDEDSDYIRLDVMREGLLNPVSHDGSKGGVEDVKVQPCVESVEDPTYIEVGLKDSRTPDQTMMSPQMNSPSELVNGIAHESADQDVNMPDQDSDMPNEARTVCSPDGFLALLSDALAAPPVLDRNQGQQDDMDPLQITSPLSDSWLVSNDQVCPLPTIAVCSVDDLLNLPLDPDQSQFVLPSVTPLDQMGTNSGSNQPENVELTDQNSGMESQLTRSQIEVPIFPHSSQMASSPEDNYICLADVMMSNGGSVPVIVGQTNQESEHRNIQGEAGDMATCQADDVRDPTLVGTGKIPTHTLNSDTDATVSDSQSEPQSTPSIVIPSSPLATSDKQKGEASTQTHIDNSALNDDKATGSQTLAQSENTSGETVQIENDESSSNLDFLTTCREPNLDTSNLDRGVRNVGGTRLIPLGPSLSSPGSSLESSPVLRRRNLASNSPLSRRKYITSSPVAQMRDGELGVLQPLSPEHGQHLNDQYDFLRRTLSHSHRRFSTRRRPNKKGGAKRTQEGEGSENSSAPVGDDRTNSPSQQRETSGQWRDILMSTEVSPRRRNTGFETHVDQHGRTYYMDHMTRTIAFNQGKHSRAGHSRLGESTELDTRREMLDRRYRSLQRSFRRSSADRPNVSRRNQRRGLSPPSSNTFQENMSLTLTREEADAMVRGEASSAATQEPSRSKSKKKRSSVGRSSSGRSSSGRRWPFGRKSSKTIIQQTGTHSADDDFMPVFSPPLSDSEFRIPDSSSPVSTTSTITPQRSTSGSVESESSLTRSLGFSSSIRVENGTANESVATPTSSVRGSLQEGDVVLSSVQASGSELEIERRNISPDIADLGRQNSIVRSSGLSGADRSAANRARRRASTRGHVRHDTDEYTNEESPGDRRSTVLVSELSLSSSFQHIEPEQQTDKTGVEEDRSEGVRERVLSPALLNCPTLQFITRKDLYSFLNSSGEAGKAFIASRALMELVQRIRSDNFLFEKYQHSSHLVNALNKFVDEDADLPEDWEKKLNKQGKVFFIDHKHRLTTFIDPRLPLPDQEFTYTTRKASQSISSARRSILYTDEPEIRSHHVTTGVSSSSLTSTDGATPTPSVTTPTPSVTTPTGNEASVSGVQEDSGPLDLSSSTSTPPSYEDQVVAFFRMPDVIQQINTRYQRGVRPQFRNIIEEIRLHGNPALQRIQMSGSIATYELALVLSLFEEDIGRIRITQQAAAPVVVVNPPQPQPPTPNRTTNTGKSTLQRRKEAFSTKLQHFKIMMVRMGFAQGSRLKFNIRRDHLLEDAYEHIMKSDIKQLQTKRLNIAFRGEEGLDYGGPSREFFFLLSREIFNPYYGLFEYSANDTYTVQISPTSAFLQNNMDWFRFAGRVLGLVIVQGFLLDAFFTRTVYKVILSRLPTLKDLEALEPAFYNSLLWMRDNDPEPLDLTFTVEEEAFGQLNTHELKPEGMDLLVTEENKEEYIHLMLQWRLDRGVAQQMDIVKKGFAEVMPPHLLVDFDAHELEFITAGTVEIDVEDWRAHTEYRNGYHPTHPVIIWFWQAVEMFDNEQRLRLLQFVTGTSSVPFEGFKALRGSNGPKRFTIDFYSDVNAFPRTHTCFNRVDLPPYSSYEILFDKLLFAIQEGGGFGIE